MVSSGRCFFCLFYRCLLFLFFRGICWAAPTLTAYSGSVAPCDKNIRINLGGVESEMRGRLCTSEQVLLSDRLTSVVYDIGLSFEVSYVRYDTDVLSVAEKYDISGLPFINVIDIGGKFYCIFAEKII